MKKIGTYIGVIFIVITLAIIIFRFSISISNDSIAKDEEKELKNIPLPENTEIVDSISIAGKLTGNGNGMQYLGAILIKTERTETELAEHYKQYKKDEWSCLVKKQKSEQIDIVDHGTYGFKNINSKEIEKYYIIYSWGSSKNYILDSDLRGH